jgi:toxin ParE1/3/4
MICYNIQITEPGEKDLYEIGACISKKLLEPETAKKVVSKIAKEIFADMPLRNAIVIDDRLASKG